MSSRNMTLEPGILDDSLYHLLKRAAQVAADVYAEHAGRTGLTQRQYALLSCLSENEGATQTTLVDQTGIDRSTLAELAARLERQGYLRRARCRHDRRANELYLTESGRRALCRMTPLMREVDRLVLEVVPSSQRKAFLAALKALASTDTAREEEKAPVTDRRRKVALCTPSPVPHRRSVSRRTTERKTAVVPVSAASSN